ncbi:TetR/AcrR family transcriptional regulator [Streptomyces finlayi]|nr:TetR/AcrR family transcriptional regulator [Streptomyces finlayi]
METAAAQFDRDGYAGTSLSQISTEAGISLGALTFHFGSKSELARSVEKEGRSAVEEAVARICASSTPPLRQLVELTLELVRLIEHDDSVRAMLRLERERPGTPQCSSIWLPAVDDLLQRSHASGRLRPSVRPAVMATLVSHLIAGAEAVQRCHRASPAEPVDSAVGQLRHIWQLILPGISASEASHR